MANGLMPRGGGAPPPGPPGGAPGPGPGPGPGPTPPPGGSGQRRQASPEEQKTYESFVGQLINVAYDEGTAQVLSQQLRNSDNPVETIANAAATVAATVASSAGQNQVPVTEGMIVRAAGELVGDLGKNMTEAVGVPPLNESQFEGAYLRTLELLGQEASQQQGPQDGAGPGPGPAQAPPSGPGMAPAPPAGGGGGGLAPRMAPGA